MIVLVKNNEVSFRTNLKKYKSISTKVEEKATLIDKQNELWGVCLAFQILPPTDSVKWPVILIPPPSLMF